MVNRLENDYSIRLTNVVERVNCTPKFHSSVATCIVKILYYMLYYFFDNIYVLL